MRNLLYLVILGLFLCLVIVLFLNNIYDYKRRYFQYRNKMMVLNLGLIYKEALSKCPKDDFANRGVYIACIENKIKSNSIEYYESFVILHNFCELISNNLADEYACIEKVLK